MGWNRVTGVVMVLGVLACGDDPTGVVDQCMLESLPLQGTAESPIVTSVVLEAQEGTGIVVHATASDPQGDADLEDVVQTVRVFRNTVCDGTPIAIQDDLVGSGVEESFGTVVDAATEPALYQAIAGSATWPVEVTFQDAGGHTSAGRVSALVRH